MANRFYDSNTGFNWANIGDAALGAAVSGGVGALVSTGGSYLKGTVSNYFNKKSEKRAFERALQLMQSEYEYAQRYAENSPSWTVKGLRDAGINPMLPFANGFPTAPSVSSHSQNATSTDVSSDMDLLLKFKQGQLLDAQIDGQKIKNDNDRKNMGLSGRDATIARLANELGLTPDKVRDFLGFDFAGSQSSPKDSIEKSIPDILNLTEKSRRDFDATLFGYPKYKSPIVNVSKSPDENLLRQRFGESAGNYESYRQWLAHPSNQRYRGNTFKENSYLFNRDVKSGFWRKKSNGKYGYK